MLVKTMTNRLLALAFGLFVFCGCSNKESVNSFEFIEYFNADECSIYSMLFVPGNKLLFKLSTSGSCINISSDQVMLSYEKSLKDLKEEHRRLGFIDKTILLEIPNFVSPSEEELKETTQKLLNHTIECYRQDLSNGYEKIKLTIEKPTISSS